MPTGVWVNKNAKIEYTLENAIIPSGVPESAVLKAYVPAYDTYVFENMGSILWLIGWDKLDKNTEIIYHLHTNEQNELPEHRIQYGFDNKGFNTETGSRIVLGTEEDSIRNYQVFEKEIPTGYNVTVILVGFNTEGTVTWNRSFRPL